jgi:SAM-dependent methyltransferase
MKGLLPAWRRLQPSALLHVFLQARMERGMAGRPVRQDLQKAGFRVEMILANVRKLRRLVASLEWRVSREGWSGYQSCSHVERDRAAKGEFLIGALDRLGSARVLDLGANDGHFSAIAARHGAHAIAVDGDEAVLEDLYGAGMGSGISIVLGDLANPSPPQGWAGVERPGLFERAAPDLVVAYGLIHHLIYTSSIPPRAVVTWLRTFACPVVVEFVAPDDEMVAALIGNKLAEELHPGRDEAAFRSIVEDLFEIRSEHTLGTGTRVLFELDPR